MEEVILAGASRREGCPAQGTMRLWSAGQDAPWVLALHGSGRAPEDYGETPFYRKQRELCLAAGFGFAAVDNAPDTWGTDRGLHNAALAAEWIGAHLYGGPLTLWATSAGRVCAFRLAAETPERIRAILGTFAVYDLTSVFGLRSCRAAWGVGEDETARFAALVRGKNPPELTERLRGVPVFLAHGTADRAVPYERNALAAQRTLGASVRPVENGVHGTEDYRYYEGFDGILVKLREQGGYVS